MEKSHLTKIQNFKELNDGCLCKCHFGGAESCPGCKNNHNEKHHCCNC